MSKTTPTSTLENLARLAAKPGVQSTLILSRSDGSILHRTGFLAETSPSTDRSANGDSANAESIAEAPEDSRVNDKSAESIAHKVFTFMSQAQGFAEGMDATDEVRLLRLRTRRNEVVIVPESKFLHVVIHDASQAH